MDAPLLIVVLWSFSLKTSCVQSYNPCIYGFPSTFSSISLSDHSTTTKPKPSDGFPTTKRLPSSFTTTHDNTLYLIHTYVHLVLHYYLLTASTRSPHVHVQNSSQSYLNKN